MQLIILIIIIVLIVYFRNKKKNANNVNSSAQAPEPGSRAEKKAIKKFRDRLQWATGEYGWISVEAMDDVAKCYAIGDGVEKDIEKAKDWNERALRAKLQQKVYGTSTGFTGYTCDKNIHFLLDNELVPADTERALDLTTLALSNGTHDAVQYLRKIMCMIHPEEEESIKSKKVSFESLYTDYAVTNIARRARSKKIYEDLTKEMQDTGVTGTEHIIPWLLQKAEWKIEDTYQGFPGANQELEEQYQASREMEARGNDYNKTAELYEPVAAAGHSEAQRRLGILLRDILSKSEVDKEYAAGLDWLEKACSAGNALAAFDLKKEKIDVGFIAGLAVQENLDALYALGCLVESGKGGPANWGVAQFIFRYMQDVIGDPVARGDGEGIEWLRRLGEKLEIIDEQYYIRLADAGSAIGYAPSQTELLYMTEEVMRRAYAQSNDQAGSSYDFGYNRWIINAAAAPAKAGMAKAAKISRYCGKEASDIEYWGRESLSKAEQGKEGTWTLSAMQQKTPKERVEIQLKWNMHDILVAYRTRLRKGLNYYEICDEVREDKACQDSIASIQQKLSRTGSAGSTGNAGEGNVNDMPGVITDDWGRSWQREGFLGADTAVYRLWNLESNMPGDLGDAMGDTVYISNRNISGNTATTMLRTFHW